MDEAAADADSCDVQTELQLDCLLSVVDGRTYSANGGDIALDPAQHRVSPEDDGFTNQGEGSASSTSQSAS